MIRVIMSALLLVVSALAVSAQDRYTIQPGDVLQIEVLEDNSLNRNALVLPDGTISFPLVGTVRAGGRSVGSVQSAIVNGLSGSFANAPNVLVAVSQVGQAGAANAAKTIDVFIMGEVNAPGKKSIDSGTSLLQFLAESGGFTRFAATKRIQLRRDSGGKSQFFNFDYKAVESGSASVNTLVLRDGDVIIVPERRLFE
jgi:polysaccharide export outer membrane protein